MKFDPEEKKLYFTQKGGLSRALKVEDISGKPFGNYAVHDLQDAIYAWLVGLQVEIAPVVSRSSEWASAALDIGEDFGESKNFHHIQLYWTQAISKWMLNALNDFDDWNKATGLEVAYWDEEADSDKWIVRNCLDDYMAFAIQAGNYEAAIKTYERFLGVKKPKLSKNINPRDYAYAACLAQTNQEYQEDEIFLIGRHMLQCNLENSWLGYGQSLRAATWLKIVYWDKEWRAGRTPKISPLQTVLNAYENMPNVVSPDFINRLSS